MLAFEPAPYGSEWQWPVGDRVTRQMERSVRAANAEFMRAGRFDLALGEAPVYFVVPQVFTSGRGLSTIRFAMFTRGGPIHRIDAHIVSDSVDEFVAEKILRRVWFHGLDDQRVGSSE